jgi:hypothetical protein
MLRIGKARVAWCSHTDTVHTYHGMQRTRLRGSFLTLHKKSKKYANCLGADDTAGVWLMRQMIKANRPGLYLFHRSEESWGKGSEHIAYQTPELFQDIDSAIAFDRKGLTSVITHQIGGRCCSDTFANSLAAMLGGYKPDSTGTFTDTANYTSLVPECTNISVGYYAQHTKDESLDVEHVLGLRDVLLDLNSDKFKIERVPSKGEEYDWTGNHSNYYDGMCSWDRDYYSARKGIADVYDYYTRDTGRTPSGALVDLVLEHPDEIADILESYGYDYHGLCEDLLKRGVIIRRPR